MLYALLARLGFFPAEWLLTLRQFGSPLQGHPDMLKVSGVEMSAGSLGMGISAGIGMSWAVLRELLPDLDRHGWKDWVPLDGASVACALSAMPSVTLFSRASLLCGALVTGGQSVEKRGFEEHAGLRIAGKSPVLFHKDEIGASGGDLAEAVRLEIRNPNRKVVGAVINVVDDSLAGPEQLAIRWSLDQVPVLRALLSEARDAGRVVILLSDHGHVLDHGSTLNRWHGEPDRWRKAAADQPPSVDELLVTGSRILADDQLYISPVTETIRYTPNKRQGYRRRRSPA